jgi:hypothetical protein
VDAELIALCNRVAAASKEKEALYDSCGPTLEDQQRIDPALDVICRETNQIEQRLYDIPRPSTMGGLRAMAAAALALAPKDLDGDVEYPAGMAEWLALELSAAIVDGAGGEDAA